MRSPEKEYAANRGSVTVLFTVLLVLGAAGLIFYLRAGISQRAWHVLLINFLFFAPLSAGMVTWSAVLRLSHGRWARDLERLVLAGISFSLPSVLALIVLWVGADSWFPGGREVTHGVWLNPAFVFGRNLAALLIFWGCAIWYINQRKESRAGFSAGMLIFLYAVAFSLMGFDLVMAVDPHWYSSLFGGYFFISGLYGAVALWAILSVFSRDADVDQRHDLGKLLFAFSLLTTYLMYSQLIIIWYENLPHEVSFIIPRLKLMPFRGLGVYLLAAIYLGPLIMLLTRAAKRSRVALGIIATVILTGLWFERWWLITPIFNDSFVFSSLEIFTLFVFAGLFGIAYRYTLKKIPQVEAPARIDYE